MTQERENDPIASRLAAGVQEALRGWQPALTEPRARVVTLPDGTEAIQVRLELGLLQMSVTGRPDGIRFGEFETLLEATLAEGGSHPNAREGVGGHSALASRLRIESAQFQRRAEAWLEARLPERAVADADLALRSLGGAARIAFAAEDRIALDAISSARFPLTALRVRAEAAALLAAGLGERVRQSIDAGLERLRVVARDASLGAPFELLSEVLLLSAMRDNLVPKLPGSARTELESRLRAAVLSENYELAAILRDELRMS
ncbi:MAG: hypothetical protein EXS10_06605 [Phycisphaerales bacterium]|nr:hypothetical protein [Phycisphaerales bacterium]